MIRLKPTRPTAPDAFFLLGGAVGLGGEDGCVLDTISGIRLGKPLAQLTCSVLT